MKTSVHIPTDFTAFVDDIVAVTLMFPAAL
jgi:hypothetical protein